jgi:hypothetical protein
MNDELEWNGNGHDLFQGNILAFAAGTVENHEKTQCSSQDLNQTPHECKSEALLPQTTCFIIIH